MFSNSHENLSFLFIQWKSFNEKIAAFRKTANLHIIIIIIVLDASAMWASGERERGGGKKPFHLNLSQFQLFMCVDFVCGHPNWLLADLPNELVIACECTNVRACVNFFVIDVSNAMRLNYVRLCSMETGIEWEKHTRTHSALHLENWFIESNDLIHVYTSQFMENVIRTNFANNYY